MSEDRHGHSAGGAGVQQSDLNDRLVYVVAPDSSKPGSELELIGFLKSLWAARTIIAAITVAAALISVAYVLIATPWYRSEVLLAPAESKSGEGLAGTLSSLPGIGGLASLAGINVGGGSVEAIATLNSRELVGAFIEERNLLPILFPRKWDAQAQRWKAKDERDWPDVRDGIRLFYKKILRVQEDRKTKLVTVTVTWTDARTAAAWANELVERANERMRQRALAEAEANVTYLKKEFAALDIVTMQQTIGRLLESELQKEMLARGNKEFAFRIIDHAQVAKWRDRPKRAQVIAAGTIAGLILAVAFVLVRRNVTPKESSD